MKNYKMSTEGKVFLTSLEGIALQLYLDSVNVRTIGIGVTKTEIPNINSLPWTYTITMQEAFDLLDKSLKRYVDAVNQALKVDVTQFEFDALVSICYNIGTGGLTNSTFMKRINARSNDESIKSAMMAWTKAGGKTLQGLVSRRSKEVNLFLNGEYGNGKALLFPVDSKTHRPIYGKGTSVDVRKYLKDLPSIPTAPSTLPDDEKIVINEPTPRVEDVKLKTKKTIWDYIFEFIRSVLEDKK